LPNCEPPDNCWHIRSSASADGPDVSRSAPAAKVICSLNCCNMGVHPRNSQFNLCCSCCQDTAPSMVCYGCHCTLFNTCCDCQASGSAAVEKKRKLAGKVGICPKSHADLGFLSIGSRWCFRCWGRLHPKKRWPKGVPLRCSTPLSYWREIHSVPSLSSSPSEREWSPGCLSRRCRKLTSTTLPRFLACTAVLLAQ
jgi:hypothetical protein